MTKVPAILDHNGRPVRATMQYEPPYRAASQHPDLAAFNPPNVSGDQAVLRNRDRMAARAHDLVRNDGWAATGVNRWVNSIIGKGWLCQAAPDWRALGLSRAWSREFAEEVEGKWRSFAKDPGFHCDYGRQTNMVGLFRLGLRQAAVDFETLAILQWRKDSGRAPFRTAIEIIDPARLSTPSGQVESDLLRDGVSLHPQTREATHYHIRKSHPGDRLGLSTGRYEWVEIPRETDWGRPIVIHSYERHRAGQTRPASRFAPIVQKLKQLSRYDETELQAAIINAVFAAYIKTPMDAEMFATAFGGMQGSEEVMDNLIAKQLNFHEKVDFRLGGSKLVHLMPGEELDFPAASHPNSVYAEFEQQALRQIASALDLSYEQLANDWSQTNYSSARAALLEVRIAVEGAKERFESSFAGPIYAAFLEELIEDGHVSLPAGAPSFQEARSAYCGVSWIGAGRGWVDPVKEVQGAVMRIEAGLSTLQQECAELGLDYQAVMEQRARELEEQRALGLSTPSAFGALGQATQASMLKEMVDADTPD